MEIFIILIIVAVAIAVLTEVIKSSNTSANLDLDIANAMSDLADTIEDANNSRLRELGYDAPQYCKSCGRKKKYGISMGGPTPRAKIQKEKYKKYRQKKFEKLKKKKWKEGNWKRMTPKRESQIWSEIRWEEILNRKDIDKKFPHKDETTWYCGRADCEENYGKTRRDWKEEDHE